ncbi:hypothetical protein TIFTF001_012065 [Ficus carica]|uniref:Uncharacterized protein n=1 Tax=Ficus carica TaxID=3494 RepID=A0AA87ZZR7_FICCA|nr:hypothetical protein TIFTF001_012065 [Ficus carica]
MQPRRRQSHYRQTTIPVAALPSPMPSPLSQSATVAAPPSPIPPPLKPTFTTPQRCNREPPICSSSRYALSSTARPLASLVQGARSFQPQPSSNVATCNTFVLGRDGNRQLRRRFFLRRKIKIAYWIS